MSAKVSIVDVVEAMPGEASCYVERIFPHWCDERALTNAERRVLHLAVRGFVTRRALAAELNTRTSTVKKQIQAICQKCKGENLRAVVVMVLREALQAAVTP